MMFDNDVGFDILIEDILTEHANQTVDIMNASESILESLMIEDTPETDEIDALDNDSSWESKFEVYKRRKENHSWPIKDVFEILLCNYTLEDVRKVAKNCNDGDGVDYTLELIYEAFEDTISCAKLFEIAKFIKDNSLVVLTDSAIANIKDNKKKENIPQMGVFEISNLFMSLNSDKFVTCTDLINLTFNHMNILKPFSQIISSLQLHTDFHQRGKLPGITEIEAHIPQSSLKHTIVEEATEAVLIPALEADDFDFNGGLNDIDKGINDATKASPTTAPKPKPAAPTNNAGNKNDEVENLTNTTSEEMDQAGMSDQTDQQNQNGGQNNNLENDANNMADSGGDGMSDPNAPTMDEQMSPDEGSDFDDDADGDEDDGTDKKRIIRKNFHKLYKILGDTLTSLEMFTPQYRSKVAKYYSSIKHSLSSARTITYEILTEKINDLTVEELMKKYVICNNIYDISARMLKEFFAEYNQENSKSHRGKTSETDSVVDTDPISL